MGQFRIKEWKSPKRWANDLTVILNARGGDDRFPVNVKRLAYDYSRQAFPDDPISLVQGASLPRFEGALVKAPEGKIGWGIFYNSDITSPGRINFTLAHEFGHYLLHRLDYPDGIQCSTEDMIRWDSDYRQLEQQANDFAANLLMPFDDYRSQIDPAAQPTLDEIGRCADRYGVSLMAAILRWLQYTQRRAILVKSIDGFIDWAWSSSPAFRTGAYFKTSDTPPIEIPATSLPIRTDLLENGTGTVEHGSGVWLNEPCFEHTRVSERYDFSLSLLHLGEAGPRYMRAESTDEGPFDRMASRKPGSSWLG